MRLQLTFLFSVLLACATGNLLAQDAVPEPDQPLPRPDWLAVGPPCQSCPNGGYFYDSYAGHNRFSNWYVRAEVLFLERPIGAAGQVVVQTDTPAAPLVSTGDLDLPMAPGLSLLAGRRLDSDSAWEVSYFGLNNWTTDLVVADPGNLDLPGTLGVGTDFDNADVMNVSYQSRINNVEFNVLRDHYYLAWLAGFRYISLEEEFNIAATNGLNTSNYSTRSSNNLFGGQIGARAFFHGRHLEWEVTGKVGLFGNAASQSQLVGDINDTVILRDSSSDGAAVCFVGDLNISASYRLNHVWSVRAGYNIMEITGLALAPDQLDFTSTPTSGRNLHVGGDLFLHGANIGIEAIW